MDVTLELRPFDGSLWTVALSPDMGSQIVLQGDFSRGALPAPSPVVLRVPVAVLRAAVALFDAQES